MTVLRIASRASTLAMAQTRIVADALARVRPEVEIQIVSVKTAGDQDPDQPLSKLPGIGFFTSALEQALGNNDADAAVHSFKDLPTGSSPNLTIAAVSERKHPEDALICRQNISNIKGLSEGAKVGTSSPRRIAQLRLLRPDLKIVNMRGNIETRLAKLDLGQCDALILARAGLERLGLAGRADFFFDPRLFLPAPAQGALAIQTRANDQKIIEIVKAIDHPLARLTVMSERAVLERLHPGCHAPIGVFAELENSDIIISAFVSDPKADAFIRKQIQGPREKALGLANQLADELIQAGAMDLINRGAMQ